jgi:hypothetical protein
LTLVFLLAGCSASTSSTPAPATPAGPTPPLPPVSTCERPVEFSGVPVGWTGDTGIVSFNGVPAGWTLWLSKDRWKGSPDVEVRSGFGAIAVVSGFYIYQWMEPNSGVSQGNNAQGNLTVSACVRPTPTASPTGTPTIAWWLGPTEADLIAACSNGKGLPEASDWDGQVYPYLRVLTQMDNGGEPSLFMATELLRNGEYPTAFDWPYERSGLVAQGFSRFELVVCETETAETYVGTCSYENGVTTQLYVATLEVRILAAKTGKSIASKSFNGSSSCPPVIVNGTSGKYVNGDHTKDLWIDSFDKP